MTPRKPRKMPKNQRAYKTPDDRKRHLTRLTDERASEFIAARSDIGTPKVFKGDDGSYWAFSHELRKWLALRNPPTSTGEQ